MKQWSYWCNVILAILIVMLVWTDFKWYRFAVTVAAVAILFMQIIGSSSCCTEECKPKPVKKIVKKTVRKTVKKKAKKKIGRKKR